MDDRDLTEDIKNMANEHLEVPEVPRDRMWERIDASRRDRRGVVKPDFAPKWRPTWRVTSRGVGIAATLALGMLIGRFLFDSDPTVTPTPLASNGAGTEVQGPGLNDPVQVQRDVYRLAANDLFGRADFLLTDFKVRSCGTRDLTTVPEWAGGMLVQTRLLMGTPVADDPAVQDLLEDLELVLAQIVGLSRDHCARDMAWIRSGLENRATIDRLRRMSGDGGMI
jgi:hypothetical protein